MKKNVKEFRKVVYRKIHICGEPVIIPLFVEILGVLDKEEIIDLEKVMHDGTKIKANASRKSFRRKRTIKKWLKNYMSFWEWIRRLYPLP